MLYIKYVMCTVYQPCLLSEVKVDKGFAVAEQPGSVGNAVQAWNLQPLLLCPKSNGCSLGQGYSTKLLREPQLLKAKSSCADIQQLLSLS